MICVICCLVGPEWRDWARLTLWAVFIMGWEIIWA
jgi:hypothetical protein